MKTIFILLLLVVTMTSKSQNTFIAHRGASYLAPENTVASAKLAWELDADAVEVDVHLSKDNRVMVIHDKDTKKTCNGKKNLDIKKTPSLVLRDLDAGIWKSDEFKGEKIPFIEEIIETVPAGKTLVIEIKCGPEVLPALQLAIEKSGKAEQIVFIAFDFETIAAAKTLYPEVPCYYLSSFKKDVKKHLPLALEKGLDGMNLHYSLIRASLTKKCASAGLDVWCWTVNDPETAQIMKERGVSAITTDRPAWLKEQMARTRMN